ncbi:DoxX family protein [Williamsia serinedens]|uniref:DoxX family protein n=1 Tax=Williamsia serinedens TaxID=391736 RepID=UPI0020A3F10A|nr:hypothetical protein [Williamsia serinedens]
MPWLRNLARGVLGGFLIFAGTAHLTFARDEFDAQVPGWVPLDTGFVVVASGVVEIVLGVALLALYRHKVLMGWIVAAFFVAVFPGNIAQYVDHRDAFGLDTDTGRLIRLFFQPLLIAWALWCTGAWAALRRRRTRDDRAVV